MSARSQATRTYLRSRWDRLNGPSRIAGVDLARGLAVLGMFAAHLLWIDEPRLADPSTWLGVVHGRSSILFATLAGVSIALISGGARPVEGTALRAVRYRLFFRALFLWLLGVLLIATEVPVYVILPAYGLLFLLAIPLLRLTARVLLPLAAGLAIVMPFVQVWLDDLPIWTAEAGYELGLAIGWHYPFTTWIAFLVAGMGFARLGIRSLAIQVRVLAVGILLAAVGYGLDAVALAPDESDAPSYWAKLWTAQAHSSGLLEVIGSGGFALAVIALCLLVCRTSVRYLVLPIRAVGAMPLTAYTAQIVAWAIVAAIVLGETDDLVRFRALMPFGAFAVCTLVGCTAWALLVGRGPLEWLMDTVTRVVARPPRGQAR